MDVKFLYDSDEVYAHGLHPPDNFRAAAVEALMGQEGIYPEDRDEVTRDIFSRSVYYGLRYCRPTNG